MKTSIEIKTKLTQPFQTILLSLLLMAVPQRNYAASGDVDLSFDPGSTVNGTVNAVVVQSDGKVLIGGQFTTVHGVLRNCVARLNSDGSTNTNFLAVPGLAGNTYGNPVVNCLALQNDGKILVGGSFIITNGIVGTNLMRLNADGSQDNTFSAQVSGPGVYDLWGGSVNSLLLVAGGKILVAGEFTSVNGTARTSIARLDPNGALDTTYYTSLGTSFYQPYVNAAALQGDGKIVIGGNFNQVNGTTQNYLARLNADGSPDTSFISRLGSNDGGTVQSILCQTNGRILIGGVFSAINGVPHTGIARLNADGSTDESFQATAGWVYAITVQPDDKIVIGGGLFNGSDKAVAARLNADGSLDNSFSFPAVASGGTIYTIAMQSDGRMILGGSFITVRNNLVRMNSDGSVDDSFDNGPTGPNWSISSLAIQPDQKILIGGSFNAVSGVTRNHLARLNPDGSLDTSFFQGMAGINVEGGGIISCLALQDDGRILVAGSIGSFNGTIVGNLVRLNPDGSLDNSFLQGSGTDATAGQIYSLAVQKDGKILIGGSFATVNGTPRNYIARLNSDGSLDATFLQGMTGADNEITSLALQSDGRILIAGFFSRVNGVFENGIARLNSDGSLDTAFFANPVSTGGARGVAVQPDGRIVIGGMLTSINGIGVTNFARLLPNGSRDSSFSFSGRFQHMSFVSFTFQHDGKILIMTTAPGRFFRLNTDGSVDNTFFGSQTGPNFAAGCAAFQNDGKLLDRWKLHVS